MSVQCKNNICFFVVNFMFAGRSVRRHKEKNLNTVTIGHYLCMDDS